MTKLLNNNSICRTGPATPGLLIIDTIDLMDIADIKNIMGIMGITKL